MAAVEMQDSEEQFPKDLSLNADTKREKGIILFDQFKAWLEDYVTKGSNIMSDETYNQVKLFLKTDSHKGAKGQSGDAKFRHSVRRKRYHLVSMPEVGLYDVVYSLNEQGQPRRVVPFSHIIPVLHEVHVIQTNHGGIRKTHRKLSEQYVGIPEKVVRQFLLMCSHCTLHNPEDTMNLSETVQMHRGPRPRMRPRQIQVRKPKSLPSPWVHMKLSILDITHSPDDKYNYILHLQDIGSRFCLISPLLSKDTTECASHLVNWLAALGPPHTVEPGEGAEPQFVTQTVESLKIFWPTVKLRARAPGTPFETAVGGAECEAVAEEHHSHGWHHRGRFHHQGRGFHGGRRGRGGRHHFHHHHGHHCEHRDSLDGSGSEKSDSVREEAGEQSQAVGAEGEKGAEVEGVGEREDGDNSDEMEAGQGSNEVKNKEAMEDSSGENEEKDIELERVSQLDPSLRQFVDDTASLSAGWVKKLPSLQWKLNTAVNPYTNESPYLLAFGRKPRSEFVPAGVKAEAEESADHFSDDIHTDPQPAAGLKHPLNLNTEAATEENPEGESRLSNLLATALHSGVHQRKRQKTPEPAQEASGTTRRSGHAEEDSVRPVKELTNSRAPPVVQRLGPMTIDQIQNRILSDSGPLQPPSVPNPAWDINAFFGYDFSNSALNHSEDFAGFGFPANHSGEWPPEALQQGQPYSNFDSSQLPTVPQTHDFGLGTKTPPVDNFGAFPEVGGDSEPGLNSNPVEGSIAAFMGYAGLSQFIPVLAEAWVDVSELSSMKEEELLELGLPLGAAKKLVRALRRWQGAQAGNW